MKNNKVVAYRYTVDGVEGNHLDIFNGFLQKDMYEYKVYKKCSCYISGMNQPTIECSEKEGVVFTSGDLEHRGALTIWFYEPNEKVALQSIQDTLFDILDETKKVYLEQLGTINTIIYNTIGQFKDVLDS